MNAQIQTTSACYARQPVEGTHSLREMALRGKLNLRGNSDITTFVEAVRETLDLSLPLSPNTMNERESKRLFWLGPDEWLLQCDLDDVHEIESALNERLQGQHVAVTDVSDYYTILRLRSPDAEALIRKGCPLDIHHSVFGADDITQTRFGHATVLLHKLGDGDSWNIQVRWTYAEYLWDYLVSGMNALVEPSA